MQGLWLGKLDDEEEGTVGILWEARPWALEMDSNCCAACEYKQDHDAEAGNWSADVECCQLEETEQLWSELDEVVTSVLGVERSVIGADFSGVVKGGDEEVLGR